MPIRPEPDRDQYGRYKLPTPDGKTKPFTRATTVAKALEDLNGVMKWEGRCIVAGIGARTDLYDLAATADPDDKKALARIAEDAKKAGGSQAGANRGTAVHSAFENSQLGLPVGEKHRKYVERINAALTAAGLRVLPDLVERVVVNYKRGTAGTFDNALEDALGNVYVGDLKTGSVDYPHSFAVQLAIYANAEAMISEDYKSIEEIPNFDKHRAVIIHCPLDVEDGGDEEKATGRADIYWLNIAEGVVALDLAYKVREWRKTKGLLTAVEAPVEAPPVEVHAAKQTAAEWLTERYEAYKEHPDYPGPAATRRLWPDDLPPPSKFADMNDEQLTRADKALIVLEGALELPFPQPDPRTPPHQPRRPIPAEKPTAPARVDRTDGRTVDYEDAAALKKAFARAGDEVREIVNGWVKEGHDAGTPWNLGNIDRGAVSRRFWSISRAALFLAHWRHDDDSIDPFAWAELSLDDIDLDTQSTVGAALGLLTTAQADRLADWAREGARPTIPEAIQSLVPTTNTEEEAQ